MKHSREGNDWYCIFLSSHKIHRIPVMKSKEQDSKIWLTYLIIKRGIRFKVFC